MKAKDFLKAKLEQEYLGKTITASITPTQFVVAKISVEERGPDPQLEILFESQLYSEMTAESIAWNKANNPKGGNPPPAGLHNRWARGFRESYYIEYIDRDLPVIINPPAA